MRLSQEFVFVLKIFLISRVVLVILSLIAVNFLNLGYKDRFLGGGYINYQNLPLIFSWANFDGEHYLSIAIIGYKGLEQAFFPIYPTLISIFSAPLVTNLFEGLLFGTIFGVVISNLAYLLALYFLYKLLEGEFAVNLIKWTLLLITFFPTSFYFGAVYSESLYLLFSVLTFYFAKSNRFFLSGIFGMVSSATRIFGLFLFPALIIELIKKNSKQFWILLIPLGTLAYMVYQWLTIGDPLAFYRLQKIVGEQHQSGITLLPQVYYRYFKILTTTDITNPIYQTVVLELFSGLLFFILPIYGYFKKIKLAYLFYTMVGFLTPTIQGSFSSVPRYMIVFFPAFLILSIFLLSLPKFFRYLVLSLFFIWMCFETILFLRGYWVA